MLSGDIYLANEDYDRGSKFFDQHSYKDNKAVIAVYLALIWNHLVHKWIINEIQSVLVPGPVV